MNAPLRYSRLQVCRAERRTPRPDQQAKLFFPKPGHDGLTVPPMPPDGDVTAWYRTYLAVPEPKRPWMRSYTIRRHHPDRQEIDLDFVLHVDGHNVGPGTRWAEAARPGDRIGMYGPAFSQFRTPGPHDWKLFAGDETALPAISAYLEALPAGERALVFVELADAEEEQELATAADVTVRWLYRDGTPSGRSRLLVAALRAARLPAGAMFAWVAGEASTVRALRRHLVSDRGIDKRHVAFCGYWRLHLTQDDDPTPEDVADQAEAIADSP